MNYERMYNEVVKENTELKEKLVKELGDNIKYIKEHIKTLDEKENVTKQFIKNGEECIELLKDIRTFIDGFQKIILTGEPESCIIAIRAITEIMERRGI